MTALITISGLARAFGGLKAVDGLDASVGPGEVVGLVGPNGSGKTTALNLITGNLKPDAGTIRFDGRAIEAEPAYRIARAGIARTFQLVRVMPSLSIAENVAVGAMFGAAPCAPAEALARARPLIERVGLGDRAALPAARLTYIDQKRLELARALAGRPKLLLLDEWLAGLNPTELRDGIALIRSIAAEGIAIIMVEHVMDAIRALCGRCIVMNAGRSIAQGPTAAVLAEPAVIRAYLGDDDA
ncbi:ABC transporter ATP-binding protein [Phreatobacter sp. AB_2022a]|uniref:ABC transporter ATP-binding protein n=1 Tax=Phreatobacter sp. AB_2022a TaxID=3003134 RepID=UPI00228761EF|nr:ABC transporter ATP-binding protein [Phreatobacter sp. AB_2022a]MCZ0733046.1 ABC transporter ATP-binding protein [Phreatobacter sp. AB_2022a]